MMVCNGRLMMDVRREVRASGRVVVVMGSTVQEPQRRRQRGFTTIGGGGDTTTHDALAMRLADEALRRAAVNMAEVRDRFE
jgi:hypothetical protein